MEKNRISILPKYSAILCMFVVLIHDSIPAYFGYSDNSVNSAIHYLLKEIVPSFTCIAVPSFFIMSGFLFYRNYDYSKTREKYKSRFFSLVIPYMVFNSLGLIIEMVTKLPFFSSLASYNSDPFALQNIVTGVFFHKYTVLWFVFALIIYSYLCPVIYSLVRNNRIGIFVIFVMLILVSVGLLNITLPNGLYFETSSVIYYMIGAYLGRHMTDFYSRNYSVMQSFCSLILLLIIITVQLMVGVPSQLDIIVLLLKCILFYIFFTSVAQIMKDREWHKYTFFIYLSFLPVIRLSSGLLRYLFNILSVNVEGSEMILYILAFVTTMMSCIAMAYIWKSVHIKSFSFITGNRA